MIVWSGSETFVSFLCGILSLDTLGNSYVTYQKLGFKFVCLRSGHRLGYSGFRNGRNDLNPRKGEILVFKSCAFIIWLL